MYKGNFVIILLFIFFLPFAGRSQAFSDELIANRFEWYAKAKANDLLYVHTDKTIYTNNEQIWFSAYMVKATNLDEHHFLSVTLINDDDRKVFLHHKYVMQKGLSFGSLSLPDTIPPGDYRFLATTNSLKSDSTPVAVFDQAITIRSVSQQSFVSTVSLLDTGLTAGPIRAKVTVVPAQGEQKSKEKIRLEYKPGAGRVKSATLNQNDYIISIPPGEITGSQDRLSVTVKYNGQSQYLTIKLPSAKKESLKIRFFPEGGNLVEGVPGMIGWEARSSDNLPVQTRAVLYQDDQAIDSIATTSYGIGKFRLTPAGNHVYRIKINDASGSMSDSAYLVPEALEKGTVLRIDNAVVNDTLRVILLGKGNEPVRLLIHNYREIYASSIIDVQAPQTRVSVALPGVPKGINTISLLDQLGRPLAERLFFAHHDQQVNVALNTNKPAYGRREKVQAKLKITDPGGKPIQGVISVAAVQANRVETAKYQDIVNYVYLNSQLNDIQPTGAGLDDKEYLENILFVKGWRRYLWTELMQASAADTNQTRLHSPITGQVKYYGKMLKKPLQITFNRDSLFDVKQTSATGAFELGVDDLLITADKPVVLFLANRETQDYRIDIQDPYKASVQSIAQKLSIPRYGMLGSVSTSKDQQLKGLERMVMLQEVTVKATNDRTMYGTAARGPNACGDYVCEYGILNCQNHPGAYNNAPVKGNAYKASGNSAGMVVYAGCVLERKSAAFSIEGIYMPKEFYSLESEIMNSPEPQFVSTLTWQPGILTNKDGEAELSFITGDIVGEFRLIVQGVGGNEVLTGTRVFEVK